MYPSPLLSAGVVTGTVLHQHCTNLLCAVLGIDMEPYMFRKRSTEPAPVCSTCGAAAEHCWARSQGHVAFWLCDFRMLRSGRSGWILAIIPTLGITCYAGTLRENTDGHRKKRLQSPIPFQTLSLPFMVCEASRKALTLCLRTAKLCFGVSFQSHWPRILRCTGKTERLSAREALC